MGVSCTGNSARSFTTSSLEGVKGFRAFTSTNEETGKVGSDLFEVSATAPGFSLRALYEAFSQLPEKSLLSFLGNYAPASVIGVLACIADLRGLAAALSYLEALYQPYGEPRLSYLVDEETGEPFAAAIIIPDCDWDAWRHVAMNVKAEMRKAGLKDLVSKVAVICLEGLKGPQRAEKEIAPNP